MTNSTAFSQLSRTQRLTALSLNFRQRAVGILFVRANECPKHEPSRCFQSYGESVDVLVSCSGSHEAPKTDSQCPFRTFDKGQCHAGKAGRGNAAQHHKQRQTNALQSNKLMLDRTSFADTRGIQHSAFSYVCR